VPAIIERCFDDDLCQTILTHAPKALGRCRVTHFWLVQDMARAQGADLVAARRSGALSLDDWSALLTRCRSCEHVQPCKAFLKGNRRKEEQALAGCENRQLFAELGAGV